MKLNHSADYLKGIIENDFSVLEQIYEECSPTIINYVKKNSGTLDDAKDVIQDGLIIIYKKLKNNELELTSSFQTYLYSVCRFVWLKKLKKTNKKGVTFSDLNELSIENNLEEKFLEVRKQDLFNKKLSELKEDCIKVLKMFFGGFSGKEIATSLNYSEEYAKRKKYKCKEKLVNSIKNDPEYLNILS